MNVLKEKNSQKVCCFKAIFLICFLVIGCIYSSAQESDDKKEAASVPTIKEVKPKKNQEVLFGEQAEETKIQSISSVSGERALHIPQIQMEASFYGILPGLTPELENGMPNKQLTIRFREKIPLILVDGIPRSDANIPVSQIESISVIKDGLGLSMLGMSAGGGVLNITTKRGQASSLRIGFTGQLAFNQQIFRPDFLDAYSYSNLLNEALSNDGKAPIYSDRDLQLYKSGESPYTHPNVDWYDYLMGKTAPVQQYNLTFSGGSNVSRYFVDLNYFNQGGFFKEDKSINSYSTKESFKKYTLRTNIDVNITPQTTLKANIFGQMLRENSPGNPLMGTFYPSLHETPNNAYPVFNPNGTLGATSVYQNNLYGQSILSGYRMYTKSDINIDMNLVQKIGGALEGLYLSGTYSYNSTYREELDRSKTLTVWSYWKEPNAPNSSNDYTQLTTAGTQKNTSAYNRLNRFIYGEFAAGYDFDVNKHSSRNKVLYTYSDYLLRGTSLPFRNEGVSFRTEYDYDKKYLAEFTFSAMGMNQLKPGHRWGFFPAAGLGWNLNREEWFNNAVPAINTFKLRANYGINGDDGAASYFRNATSTISEHYYSYMKFYEISSTDKVFLGGNNLGYKTMSENGIPYISKWTQIKRFTIGFDLEAFERTLSASVEFFNNNFSDIAQSRRINNSNMSGITLPREYAVKHRQNGLEFDLSYQNRFKDFNIYGSANATVYYTKLLGYNEPVYPEPYMQREGKRYNQIFGYVADGFFQSQAEIDQYLQTTKIEGYIPVPGDLKYKDLNSDGIIDGKDIKEIGTTKPRVEYGIYLGAEWKGIDLHMQWAGIANYDVTMQNLPFQINSKGGYGQAREEHLNRWTPDNPNADYPRLSAVNNPYNEMTSTFWLKDGGFLRLKNIELSYTLPARWTSALRLSKIKVFSNAYNLITISKIKDVDPELRKFTSGTTGIIPNVKSFNFGLNVQF